MEKLKEIYEHLSSLIDTKKKGEARQYIEQNLKYLPEELRNKILFEIFIEAVKTEAAERESIAEIQEIAVALHEWLSAEEKKMTEGK